MTGALVISWGSPVRGREAKGLETFGHAVERFEQLAKDGRIHSHREFFSITGKNGGFMIIEGDLHELQKIQTEDEQLRLMARASAITDDFRADLFIGGSDRTVQESMNRYVETTQELGYL